MIIIFCSYLFRSSEIQNVSTDNIFYTPGIVYRPKNLKKITVLRGGTETRIPYQNFEIDNLNKNDHDPSHQYYTNYLKYQYFLPPGEKKYWEHTTNNVLPAVADNIELGLFNVFPIDLTAENLPTPTTSLGKAHSAIPVHLRFFS
jgi:hypothetical protein